MLRLVSLLTVVGLVASLGAPGVAAQAVAPPPVAATPAEAPRSYAGSAPILLETSRCTLKCSRYCLKRDLIASCNGEGLKGPPKLYNQMAPKGCTCIKPAIGNRLARPVERIGELRDKTSALPAAQGNGIPVVPSVTPPFAQTMSAAQPNSPPPAQGNDIPVVPSVTPPFAQDRVAQTMSAAQPNGQPVVQPNGQPIAQGFGVLVAPPASERKDTLGDRFLAALPKEATVLRIDVNDEAPAPPAVLIGGGRRLPGRAAGPVWEGPQGGSLVHPLFSMLPLLLSLAQPRPVPPPLARRLPEEQPDVQPFFRVVTRSVIRSDLEDGDQVPPRPGPLQRLLTRGFAEPDPVVLAPPFGLLERMAPADSEPFPFGMFLGAGPVAQPVLQPFPQPFPQPLAQPGFPGPLGALGMLLGAPSFAQRMPGPFVDTESEPFVHVAGRRALPAPSARGSILDMIRAMNTAGRTAQGRQGKGVVILRRDRRSAEPMMPQP